MRSGNVLTRTCRPPRIAPMTRSRSANSGRGDRKPRYWRLGGLVRARHAFLRSSGTGRMTRECPRPRPKYCVRVASLPVFAASGFAGRCLAWRGGCRCSELELLRPDKAYSPAQISAWLDELSAEYLTLTCRLSDLDEDEYRRAGEIERNVYEFFGALGPEAREASMLSFQAFASLVISYRIWPEEFVEAH